MRLYAENNTNYIKSLDNGSLIKLQVVDDDNSLMDLTKFESVLVKIGTKDLGTILTINPSTASDDGIVEFSIPNASLPYGKYYIEVHMFIDAHTVRISPSDSNFEATVTKSMDEIGNEIAVISVQQLISEVNEVKMLAEDSNNNVKLAIDSTNNAVDMATTANINATQAISNSQNAIAESSDALEKANQAITDSTSALSTANTANVNANEALNNSETALTNSQNAILNSTNALSKANTASVNASEALTKANQAIVDSSNAITKSNNADTNATNAINNSQEAITISNEAKSLATSADTNATQAKTDSSTALLIANSAKVTADQVRSEFDQIVSGSADAELINARTNANGTTFTNLKARLDDSDSKLNQTTTTVSNLQQTLENADKNAVGLGNVDNTSDLDKPISTATQTELDKKYEKPSTGIPKSDLDSTVQSSLSKADTALQSVTKSDIGLGNVDNTSDLDKPISTATQNALDDKATVQSVTDLGNKIGILSDTVTTHVEDYVSHYGYGTTTNAGNDYSVTLNPVPTSYKDGMGVKVKINADSTDASTLNVNELGAISLKDESGEDIKDLKENGIYVFTYNATTSNFQLQGRGGGSTIDASILIPSINGILKS